MLSASIAAVLLLVVTGVAVRAQFSTKSLVLSVVVIEVLGLVLLGLPGAVFLETLDPIMQRAGRGPLTGDGAWPAAILMSVVWPVALAPAYLLARTVRAGNGPRGLAAFAVLLSTCALLSVLVYVVAT